MAKRIVILGAGESGAGAAVLAQKQGFDTFVSDMSLIKDKYKNMLNERGISGKAANAVAKKLKAIAKKHQVMCISHLPNIAATADYNYFISKEIKDKRTKTQIRLLEENEVIQEIARISSGEINEITLKYAEELRSKKAS